MFIYLSMDSEIPFLFNGLLSILLSFFDVQIAPNLANGSPLQLPPMSFYKSGLFLYNLHIG